MKQILTLLALTAGLHTLFAQTTPLPVICGNEVFSHIVREKYPELDAAFRQTFEEAQRNSHAAAAQRSALNVRVVVHVVWNGPEENLADSIILNQIQVLNEDYNRMNADTGNLRPDFQFVAGSADIHFELAEIVRVQTDALFEIDVLGNDLLSSLKSNATGGSDAWDTEHYLNIWVCKIQPTTIFGFPVGQILGFAFPPNGLANWPEGSNAPTAEEDGVVIDFRAFGSNNPNVVENPGGGDNLVMKGRTPVHEVGHYLGLRHIWGDGGLFGPNDCAQSDGIEDTPFASAQSAFDCDLSKNSCEQVELFYNEDPLDLVENYMDYSSESCMNMFTKGQVAQMRSVLMGPRAGLLDPVSTRQPVAALDCKLFPNPAQDRVVLALQMQDQAEVNIRITGADGRSVLDIPKQTYFPGQQQIALDTRRLPTGMYFVHIQANEKTAVQKLSIQR
ncbi:MAG: T9SS type A sorting domain-containing protein [Saprospiraceae bacterium]|nr:T9SS type A sorting domain-containing protein [Saprospiraceae bacterium]